MSSIRPEKEIRLVRSSYNFEKRRKELAKKKKNEEKLERKRARKGGLTPETPGTPETPETLESPEGPESIAAEEETSPDSAPSDTPTV
jgi:hypothetical protein